jgi:hypothetical protein
MILSRARPVKLLGRVFVPRHFMELSGTAARIYGVRGLFQAGSERRMAVPQQLTDTDLLRRMLAGDEEAFTALYRRRQGGVYRFALQMSGSEAVAEDVVQETFMVLMREGGNFDAGRGSVSAYLYGIARNHVLRAFDREREIGRASCRERV